MPREKLWDLKFNFLDGNSSIVRYPAFDLMQESLLYDLLVEKAYLFFIFQKPLQAQ